MSQWRSIAKEAVDRAAIVVKFLCLLHVTDTYICSTTHVYGPSMFPTFNLTGDVILADRFSHRLGRVGPGDVVLVKSPVDPRKSITKRIIAMEGHKISFPVDPRNIDRCQTLVVPRGHVWIQGDNLYASNDSRHFGPVPYGLIEGKAILRVWPPDGFGSISN